LDEAGTLDDIVAVFPIRSLIDGIGARVGSAAALELVSSVGGWVFCDCVGKSGAGFPAREKRIQPPKKEPTLAIAIQYLKMVFNIFMIATSNKI
jgi:hypothetical protein